MKKFTKLTICIFALLGVLFSLPLSSVKAYAETIVTSRLEYFELDKPIAVDRDEQKVFIAQKDLIVIYHDETYDKIEIEGGNITDLQKCGNHLLFLNANNLYSLNLATYESSNVLFNGVNSFSVNGLLFAINRANVVEFFEVSDAENFLYSQVFPDYQTGNVEILQSSPTLALAPNLTFYYFASQHVQDVNTDGRQGYTFDKAFESISQICYTDKKLYFKSADLIYSYEFDTRTVNVEVELMEYGIFEKGGFSVDGNLMLICDTQNDRVLEYDLLSKRLTGFEISFTKINLPQDFALDFESNPRFITVNDGDRLYDIDLDKSIQNGYFLFNGYYNQKGTRKYLLVKEINDSYYLIAGDCFALVLKENYSPQKIQLTQIDDAVGFFTNDANCYNFPMLEKQFASFEVKKHDRVDLSFSLSFNGINYYIIAKDGKLGFIPATFILDSIYTPEEYKQYATATTVKGKTSVYSDAALADKIDTLNSFTSIVIISESDTCYYISYNQGKSVGFIAKDSVKTKGSYTNRNVAVIVILAFSLCITAIYLLLKYLYKPKKKL